jgi:hypothetical protein
MHRWMRRIMPSPEFDRLRAQLINSGVAPRHVARAILELRDHLEDIESEGIKQGLSQDAAKRLANARIGTLESIASQYLEKAELKHWLCRHPWTARVVLPIAYVMVLPAIPIFAGIKNAAFIARWCACLILGAFVTATMLLLMQISIAIA